DRHHRRPWRRQGRAAAGRDLRGARARRAHAARRRRARNGLGAMKRTYRMAFGTTPQSDGTAFRLYAPQARHVALRLEGEDRAMTRDGEWFSLTVAEAKPGMRYHYV